MPVREQTVVQTQSVAVPINEIDLVSPKLAPETPLAPAVVLRDADDWLALIGRAELKGPVRDLAAHATFVGHVDDILTLAMPDGFEHLRTDAMTGKLADALAPALGGATRVAFAAGAATGGDSLHARTARQRDERQSHAERAFLENPTVQRYMQQFGAKLVPDSIRPVDPE